MFERNCGRNFFQEKAKLNGIAVAIYIQLM